MLWRDRRTMKAEEQAAQRIADASHILLVCHISPDGDAIGSLLGLGLALVKSGKHVTLTCADPVPTSFHHLPHWQMIAGPPNGGGPGNKPHYELIVSLDCSDLDRWGRAYDVHWLAGIPIVVKGTTLG